MYNADLKFYEAMLGFFDVLPIILIIFGVLFLYLFILLVGYLRTGIMYHKTLEDYYGLKINSLLDKEEINKN